MRPRVLGVARAAGRLPDWTCYCGHVHSRNWEFAQIEPEQPCCASTAERRPGISAGRPTVRRPRARESDEISYERVSQPSSALGIGRARAGVRGTAPTQGLSGWHDAKPTISILVHAVYVGRVFLVSLAWSSEFNQDFRSPPIRAPEREPSGLLQPERTPTCSGAQRLGDAPRVYAIERRATSGNLPRRLSRARDWRTLPSARARPNQQYPYSKTSAKLAAYRLCVYRARSPMSTRPPIR